MRHMVCYGVMVLGILFSSLSAAADLTVSLVGLRSTAGVVRLSVYNQAETFLTDNGRITRHKELVTGNPMHVTLTGLPPGTYAVSVVHDENNDGQLNRNLLGIPLEGYGFSNDAPTFLGPPRFAQAALSLPQGHITITITIRYYKQSSVGEGRRPVTTPRQ